MEPTQDNPASEHPQAPEAAAQQPAGEHAAFQTAGAQAQPGEQAAGEAAAGGAGALAEAQAKIAELNESYLRAKAETENVRRRSAEDVAKARKFAIEGFAEHLLPVVDSLEAALADTSGDPAKLREATRRTAAQYIAAGIDPRPHDHDFGGSQGDLCRYSCRDEAWGHRR